MLTKAKIEELKKIEINANKRPKKRSNNFEITFKLYSGKFTKAHHFSAFKNDF